MRRCWYNLRNGIRNLRLFLRAIWRFRGGDYSYTFNLLKIAFKEHLRVISEDDDWSEVAETRIPKEEAIKRCLELLDNIERDDFSERCGYKEEFETYFVPIAGSKSSKMETTATPEQTKRNLKAIFDGMHLQEREFSEFLDILGDPSHGIKTWWK